MDLHMCFVCVLQSTRVGMSVNAVRKQSSEEEVQNIAKSLIKSWKKLLGRTVCSLQHSTLCVPEQTHITAASPAYSKLPVTHSKSALLTNYTHVSH